MRGIRSTTKLGATLAATALGATLAGPAQAQAPGPAVSIRVLPAGTDFSSPAEILENGVAVGTEGSFAFGQEITEGARPWIWTGRQRQLLPIGTAAAGWVVDAAEPGLIVGDVLRADPATGTTRRHAVAWRPSGVADLAPGAAGDTGAASVNRRGDVLTDAEGVVLVARDGGRTVVTRDASTAGVSVNDRREVLYRRAYAGGGQGVNYWRGDGTDVSVASTVPQWGNPLCYAGVTNTGWTAASFVSFGPTYNLRLRHRSGDTFALQAPPAARSPSSRAIRPAP